MQEIFILVAVKLCSSTCGEATNKHRSATVRENARTGMLTHKARTSTKSILKRYEILLLTLSVSRKFHLAFRTLAANS